MSIGNDIRAGLLLNLTVAAALADATPAQREQLKNDVNALLPQLHKDGKTRPIYVAIYKTMGEEWKPSGEYATYINNLKR